MKLLKTIFFFLSVFISPNLHAEISTVDLDWIKIGFPGEYRWMGIHLTAIDFDLINTQGHDKVLTQNFVENRLKIDPFILKEFREGAIKKIAVESEIELINNVLWASEINRNMLSFSRDVRISHGSPEADEIKLEKLFLTFSVPPFILKAGRQKSHWGLGMLANDGEEKVAEELNFGYKKFGDIVDRAFLYIMPLGFFPSVENKKAVFVSIGGDRIISDALAEKKNRDEAYQIVSTASLNLDTLNAGLYYLYRWQKNYLDDRTKAHVVDGFAKFSGKWGNAGIKAEGEFTLVDGKTELMRNVTYPSTNKILSFGALTRLGFSYEGINSLFEFGYASGDKNPFDDNFNTFSFNPDYRVGLIMFHEYIKAVTAVQAYNMTESQYSYEPPRGYKEIPSDGSVQNAFYFYPRASYKPAEWIEFMAGFLVARSAVKLVDPFRTALAGGKEVSPLGGKASDSLGYEVDLGCRFNHDFDFLKLVIAAEYGYFQPGDAFTYSDGKTASPVSMFQARGHILW